MVLLVWERKGFPEMERGATWATIIGLIVGVRYVD